MLTVLLATGLAHVPIERQALQVVISPDRNRISVVSTLSVEGPGSLELELTERARINDVEIDGAPSAWLRDDVAQGRSVIQVDAPPGRHEVRIAYGATLEEDVAAGERPGAIHNFAVQAHVGPNGVFLADGASWHPRPLDGEGRPVLHMIDVAIEPLDGWVFVASGAPGGDGPVDEPRWRWTTPRPVDGAAVAGNRHRVVAAVHETDAGPVEIAMHVSEANERVAGMFLDAARSYLDLYVQRLGAFPYPRFTIVENFFSSGFAMPGFTVLGPQVVAMAPRSLAPGYLDHEMLHAWWGNGVYVEPLGGNWCEALTSYGANYFRRVAEDGSTAGRDYRRGIVMKLSTAPTDLDDAPLATFGSANRSGGGAGRFVGYDKGAFVFIMLADVLAAATTAPDADAALWSALRAFADEHMGSAAGWPDLQAACERLAPDRDAGWLDGFFQYWVREHNVPHTVVGPPSGRVEAFIEQLPEVQRPLVAVLRAAGDSVEVDPGFRIYRVLPPEQLVPTIAGTTGPGGADRVAERRAGPQATMPAIEHAPDGENLVLVGRAALAEYGELLSTSSDPITADAGSFTVGGVTHDGAEQAVLHTMAHPRHAGRYVTVFLSNGPAGWDRLRLIGFYTRDTTVVWDGGSVIERGVHEPSRRISLR